MSFLKKYLGQVVNNPNGTQTDRNGKVMERQVDAWEADARCGCGINCCDGYITIPDVANPGQSGVIWFKNGMLQSGSMADFLSEKTDVVLPVFVSALVDNGAANKIVITFSEDINPMFVPAVAAFAASGKTVTLVEIAGATVTLTVDTAYVNGNTITTGYTQPVNNKLRDANNNYVASYTAMAVTNNVS